MPERTYIVTFDVTDPDVDLDGLKDFVTTSRLIHAWWNHIPSVFLLSSSADAKQLGGAIRRFTRDARMLVTAIDPADSDGWLTERSWKWIRRRSGPSKSEALLNKIGADDSGPDH